MKKMPTLFIIDRTTNRATDEIDPRCAWVVEGKGTASRKRDGSSVMVRDGKVYKRFDAHRGRTIPEGAIPCEESPDPKTGHWPHWVPVGSGPDDRYHREAMENTPNLCDGTWELVGPKVNGNKEKMNVHLFLPHGGDVLDCPRDYEGLKAYLMEHDIEGVVFRDGEKYAKVRRKDFGIKW